MQNIIKKVEPKCVIYFANGSSYELPYMNKNKMTENLRTYCKSCRLKEKLYSSSGSNIVGNIVGSTLSLNVISNDKLLIPNFIGSKYFGYMNDTAYIDVSFYLPEVDVTVDMGRYYVDTWEAGIQSGNENEVSISCVNLMSKIKNMTLHNIRLYRNMKFNDFLKIIIDNLNSRLPGHMQILYNDDDLKIFRNSSYDWQMHFNNIERDTVESLFNAIAKYTISYIWIGRDRHIKTDHLLDDKVEESVFELSGLSNVFQYTNRSGDIDKYSGVRVKYIDSISYEDKELLSIDNLQLFKGDNSLENLRLSSDKVSDIHTIEIVTDKGSAVCKTFNNYKNSMNMIIKASTNCRANIRVYGKVINELYGTVEKYIDENNKGTVLEIENRVLIKQLINTYGNGLNNMMSMKNNRIQVNGYLSPEIELGYTGHFIGSRFGIDDYYKTVGLEFIIDGSYRCNSDLLKTIVTDTDAEDILYDYNILLYKRLCGEHVDSSEYRDITEVENEIAYNYIKDELDELCRLLGVGL